MEVVQDREFETFAEKAMGRRGEAVVLGLLAAVQFTSIVDFMVVMPLGPELKEKLSIGNFQFGLIVSSYTISAGLAGVLASSVLDRYGRKSAFLTLYAGFLVGTLFCGLARSYWTLLSARVVTGCVHLIYLLLPQSSVQPAMCLL